MFPFHSLTVFVGVVVVWMTVAATTTVASSVDNDLSLVRRQLNIPLSDECLTLGDVYTDCVAQHGTGTTADIGHCLTCTDDSRPTFPSSDITSCDNYQTIFCQAIDDNCLDGCDESQMCGQAYTDYVHCVATHHAVETFGFDGTTCDVACDGIDGGVVRPPNNDPDCTQGCVDQALPFKCEPAGGDLRQCMSNSGRSQNDYLSCISCINQSKPPIDDDLTCLEYDGQFCVAVNSCDSLCAMTVCGNNYASVAKCVADQTVLSDGQRCSLSCSIFTAQQQSTKAATSSTMDQSLGLLGLIVTTVMGWLVVFA